MNALKKYLAYAAAIIVTILIVVAIALPYLLQSFGFHPDYDGEEYHLQGRKALIVTTSHGVLNKPGETEGNATGVFGSEMTIPYYEFLDAKMQVDVASIAGREIPIEEQRFITGQNQNSGHETSQMLLQILSKNQP